jgi:hypothetical protein
MLPFLNDDYSLLDVTRVNSLIGSDKDIS